MAVLTPSPKMQFESAAGVPLSGGKLYTYAAGTTTPQATYTDASGGTPNTNPVILDSRGEASIWLGSASYKFRLTDANDVEVWTVDYISAPTSGVSPILSGNVTIDSDTPGPALKITQTGTGAALRVQDSVDPDATPFIIDGSGNVGIGITAPSVQLEATGAAKLGSLSLTTDPLSVANGGTGLRTLTSNNVILGAGTSAPQFVAPGTNRNVLTSDGSTWLSSAPITGLPSAIGQIPFSTDGSTFTPTLKITRGTAAAGSGTTIDFTGIPSWARRVTILMTGISVGSGNIRLQLGTSGPTYLGSGYVGAVSFLAQGSSTQNATNFSSGFLAGPSTINAISGVMTLFNITGNVWVMQSVFGSNTIYAGFSAGHVDLGGTLVAVRLSSSAGGSFSTGTFNIFYE